MLGSMTRCVLGSHLKSLAYLGLIATVALGLSPTLVHAQVGSGTPEHPTVEMKELTGEVGVVRPTYLTLVYGWDPETRTDNEMVFPIDENVALLNRNSLDEFAVGDTVSVTYEEKRWTTPEGQDKAERHATGVRFISAANTADLNSGP